MKQFQLFCWSELKEDVTSERASVGAHRKKRVNCFKAETLLAEQQEDSLLSTGSGGRYQSLAAPFWRRFNW